MIDEIDAKILTILQEDARTSFADIARRVGMAPSAIHERVRKLEERGVLVGYHARVTPRAVDLPLLAYVFVRSDARPGVADPPRLLAEIPNVLEVHHIAGEDCYLVKVRARDPEDLGRLIRTRFAAVPTIVSTRTTIVLETTKDSTSLPLPTAPPDVVSGANAGANAGADTGADAVERVR